MLNECTSCREPLFPDMKVCPQCGAGNPTFQAPRWRRNALIAGCLVVAIIVSSILDDIVPALYLTAGFVLLSIGIGVAVLRDRGAKTLVLWVAGNVGLCVLALVVTVGALIVVHVHLPFFLIYGGAATMLLRRLAT